MTECFIVMLRGWPVAVYKNKADAVSHFRSLDRLHSPHTYVKEMNLK